jgi:adenosine deaminase
MLPIECQETQYLILKYLTFIISETNGVSMADTLDLLVNDENLKKESEEVHQLVVDFENKLRLYSQDQISLQVLLDHPVSLALEEFFKLFPLKYHEEHIHLTGSLTAEFIYPRLKKLLEGPNGSLYKNKIKKVYGRESLSIENVQDVDDLIRLKENQGFFDYLNLLFLPALILTDKQAHRESSYHLANELYYQHNVGKIRLKFSISRASTKPNEQIPGQTAVTIEDVVMGLYEGFKEFQKLHPDFEFILSPSFRKEGTFFDSQKYPNRQSQFEAIIDSLIDLLDENPFLKPYVTDIDTVGSELELYRKGHFNEFKKGFRKLQYRGFNIRSHHGEVFHTLKKGVQAVDNAMNIWHIETLEHGLSLGINPNYYFHRLYQRVLKKNKQGIALSEQDPDYQEIIELDWSQDDGPVLQALLSGQSLTEKQRIDFLKAKFHTAREVEHYQHDVLNRMIQKGVSLVTLPSSNNKLTGQLEEYKDHPFSWWEKKGVSLGLGTDNYVTLNTTYIREMLILLYTDSQDLKITKLLMVATHETRRPFISHLLWKMHKQFLINIHDETIF